MATRHAITSRNALLNAGAALCNAGKLRYYTGAQPSAPEKEATGELLCELTLGAPAFQPAKEGQMEANKIAVDVSARATGDAGWFRIVQADGSSAVFDGKITKRGGGGQIELDTVFIQAGAEVSCESLTIALPM